MFVSGDVVFKGLGTQNLSDLGDGGEHDIVFDMVTSKVDRFDVDNEKGSEFVIGWFIKRKIAPISRGLCSGRCRK